jgi:PmbA protein
MVTEYNSKESLLDLSQQLVKYANTKDITASEVFFYQKKNTQVMTEGLSISTERAISELGFGIRVLNKEVEGFSYTNKINLNALKSCVDEAVSISQIAPPKPGAKLPVPTNYSRIDGIYTNSVAELTIEDMIDSAKIVLQPMREAKVSVRTNLSRIVIEEEISGIVNSLGVESYSRSNSLSGTFIAVAREGEKVGSFVFDDFYTHDSSEVDFFKFGETLTSRAIRNLDAITPPTIDSDIVVFSKNGVFRPIFMVIAHSIRADSVEQGRSLWADKLADSVAINTFNFIDDSHNPDAGSGCRHFDDEGNATQKTSIIKDGVLETFLFDELRANRMDTNSTGNSWRSLGGARFVVPPSEIYPNAPYILPGDMSTEEIYEDINLGIIFEYFSGSFRMENGIFSGVAKGAQLIRKGELAEPLTNISIGGNVFELLSNIVGLSKETQLTNEYLTTPLIKAKGVKISTQKS